MGKYFEYSKHYAPSEVEKFDYLCGKLSAEFETETGRKPNRTELAVRLYMYAHEVTMEEAFKSAELQKRVIREFYGVEPSANDALEAFVLASTCELIANGEVPYDRGAKRFYASDYHPVAIVDTNGMDQGTPEQQKAWRAMRQHYGIGGSECGSLFGINPFDNNISVFNNKMGIEKEEEIDPVNQFRFDYGHCAEEPVSKYVAKRLHAEKMWNDTVMYRHPYYPWMIADLDRRLLLKGKSGELFNAILELKTANWKKKEEWQDGNVPESYVMQVRHYMSVMNINVTFITCCFGNSALEIPITRIPRDRDAENGVVDIEREFWLNNVLTCTAPKPNGSPSTRADVWNAYHRRVSDPNRAQVAIPEEFRSLLEELDGLEERKKEAKDALTAIEDELEDKKIALKEFMDVAESGVFNASNDEIYEVSYKTSARDGFDKDALRLVLPNVYNDYVQPGKPYRTLKIKRKRKPRGFVMPSN